jgi:hypothetical protein|tara:strand:+ start:144 stop:320 length:177 start_codon:yes stop_codon:yes gene_type:complete
MIKSSKMVKFYWSFSEMIVEDKNYKLRYPWSIETWEDVFNAPPLETLRIYKTKGEKHD